MYAVIAEVNGTLAWYGAYEDRDYVDNLAKALGGDEGRLKVSSK